MAVTQASTKSNPPNARERGFAGLAMAMLGLMAVTYFVVPAIISASHSALLQRADSLKEEHLRSGTEHALWRIKNDADFPSEFSGAPWAASYTLNATDFSADINVITKNYSAPDDDISASIEISPATIPVNSTTTVLFTLDIYNSDLVTEKITAIEVLPDGFSSESFVSGSASGMTTANPTTITGGWRWNFWPYEEIGPLGGEAELQWSLDLRGSQGNYATDVVVFTESGEQVHVPLGTTVKATAINDLSIESTVSKNLVEADETSEFEYQLFIEHEGPGTVGVSRIRHYAPSDLTFVPGSTSGVSTSNPSITTGQGPDGNMTRYTWTFSSFNLNEGVPQSLKFRLQGALPLGEHYSESTFRISGDGAPSSAFSISTGQTNRISATRRYEINVAQDTNDADVEAWILNNETVVFAVEK